MSASRAGSVGSGGWGLPVATEQNPQLRVQTLPRIRTVAVPRPQHSPRFGQLAFVQIVSSPSDASVSQVC
jgi:hypothetical protein